MAGRKRWEINIGGVVQGVGFRPFIYQLAQAHYLNGFVMNHSEGVRIEAEGPEETLSHFVAKIKQQKPSQAIIESIKTIELPLANYHGFFIRSSERTSGYSLISPDIATCHLCQDEIFSPGLRKNYPFTNCTNCGPRFTIIEDLPYDRNNTTMRVFNMCPQCKAEYEEVTNRRFHAQPIACPICGPQLSLVDPTGHVLAQAEPALDVAAQVLREGKIVAIKGLGGFLLACDATNPSAVANLRTRKKRPHKPLAVMVKDLNAAADLVSLSTVEQSLLLSASSPIVLAKRKNAHLSPIISPDNSYIGIMLPYTPLHHLLLNALDFPLVMTSGNLAEEPICTDNLQAFTNLATIADLFLWHNRSISCGYDDSVAWVAGEHTYLSRRARGYAPYPIKTKQQMPQLAAYGSHDKNTFSLSKDNLIFVSEHIGDMGYTLTDQVFQKVMQLYRGLFKINPQGLVADKHPDYTSTRLAQKEAQENHLPLVFVQHHHAHIAACMAENQLEDRSQVIGLAFDGSGLGDDGNIWGGEVLLCSFQQSRPITSLQYLPLAGGENAIRFPSRLAYGYLRYLDLDEQASHLDLVNETEKSVISQQIKHRVNTPLCSSLGRLFDVVSAILGFKEQITYDGQAAVVLEEKARQSSSSLSYVIRWEEDHHQLPRLNIKSIISDILADYRRQVSPSDIARRLHNTVVQFAVQSAKIGRHQTGVNKVCLSGGVFSNRILARNIRAELDKEGFTVYSHRLLPANDGCLSVGQIAVGAALWSQGEFPCV